SGELPEALQKANALAQIGLNRASLTTDEQAAGDIMGSLITMSAALLFSSSPYSPYYFDERHPDFLRRAADAVSHVHVSTKAQSLLAQSAVVQCELERLKSISGWSQIELRPPAPIREMAVRNGCLWIGCCNFPDPRLLTADFIDRVTLRAQLLKVTLKDLFRT